MLQLLGLIGRRDMHSKKGKKRGYRGRIDQGFFGMGTPFSGAREGIVFDHQGGCITPPSPPPCPCAISVYVRRYVHGIVFY